MIDRYFNPFQAMELRLPSTYREEVSRYCQGATQDGKGISLGEAPFPRVVDMWFLALCLAANNRKRLEDLALDKTYKFMDGTVLTSDPWRIDALMLLAVGMTSDPEIVADPRKIINLSNQLAAAGMPEVLDMLKNGDSEAIYNLSDNLEAVMRKG
jgi:hypothetical protein